MTPEESRRDEAVRWLAQARKDLHAARLLASAEPGAFLRKSVLSWLRPGNLESPKVAAISRREAQNAASIIPQYEGDPFFILREEWRRRDSSAFAPESTWNAPRPTRQKQPDFCRKRETRVRSRLPGSLLGSKWIPNRDRKSFIFSVSVLQVILHWIASG